MAGERAIIGIDPGLDGALARLWPVSGNLQIADMPTLTVRKSSGGEKRIIDEYALARLIDDWAPTAECVWLELVNAMPSKPGPDGTRATMGAQSAFNFGRTYGLIRGICAANFLTIHDVVPVVWKRALQARGAKDESRLRASTLYPRYAEHWARKKDDGRAESVLIAHYGSLQAVRAAA